MVCTFCSVWPRFHLWICKHTYKSNNWHARYSLEVSSVWHQQGLSCGFVWVWQLMFEFSLRFACYFITRPPTARRWFARLISISFWPSSLLEATLWGSSSCGQHTDKKVNRSSYLGFNTPHSCPSYQTHHHRVAKDISPCCQLFFQDSIIFGLAGGLDIPALGIISCNFPPEEFFFTAQAIKLFRRAKIEN